MTKLYEITERYNNLLNIIEDNEYNAEISTIIHQSLDEIKEEFTEKALNIVKFIKNIESDINELDFEEKRIKNKKIAYKNRLESLKNYLQSNMIGGNIKKLNVGIFNLSIAKNPPSLKILNEQLIPKNYFIEQAPKIDMISIKNAIKNGEVIKGCELIQNESLRIK